MAAFQRCKITTDRQEIAEVLLCSLPLSRHCVPAECACNCPKRLSAAPCCNAIALTLHSPACLTSEADTEFPLSHVCLPVLPPPPPQCFNALCTLRRDMYALRIKPMQQQTFCGFNVPLHLQPKMPHGVPPDEAFRMIFLSGVSKAEIAAAAAEANVSRGLLSLGFGAFKKLKQALSFKAGPAQGAQGRVVRSSCGPLD